MVAPVVLVKPILAGQVVQGILQAAAVVEQLLTIQLAVANLTAAAVAAAAMLKLSYHHLQSEQC
jgi:hypothetical protein